MSESTGKPGTTHFGFRDVPVADLLPALVVAPLLTALVAALR